MVTLSHQKSCQAHASRRRGSLGGGEELVGRWIGRGREVVRLVETDSVEARVSLDAVGAAFVQSGLPVRLVSYADLSQAIESNVTGVSTAAVEGDTGPLEARVRVPASLGWRPGVTGEARITLRKSNLFGATWWAVRSRMRSDLWL